MTSLHWEMRPWRQHLKDNRLHKCSSCDGTGYCIDMPCPPCKGTGRCELN